MEAAGVLSVAFGLGLLLHASQAAFFTAISGHIKTLFLHRRRLVLLSFLLCVSIFSITQFATLLLLEDASCGVAVRFTLFFDQAARVAALALIIWKVCDEAGARTEAVMWVSIIVLRILMGGIMVGFTGMTFMPVCFPQPMHVVVGIVLTSFDGTVWAVLGWRIIGIWMLFVDQGRAGNGGGKSQGYGLFLIVLGFVGWTIGSFPYMMSVGGSIFIRMIPYILTLALALGVLSCFPSIVFSVPIKNDDSYNSHKLRRFGSSVSSPPRRGRSASSPTFNDPEANKFTSYGMGSYDKNYNGARNSQMFRSILGAPIVHPGTALPWSLDTDVTENITRPKPVKASENRRPSVAPSHGGKASISGPIGPILRNGSFDAAEGTAEGQVPTSNPFGKVKTIDLRTAAEAERQRIDAAFEREQERKSATPSTAKSTTPGRSMDRSTSVKRKPLIPQLPSGPAAYRVSAVSGLRGVPRESGVDSPSSLRQSVYAGEDWGTGYVTRANSISTEDDDTTRYTVVSHAPYTLGVPSRGPPPRIPQLEGIGGDAKVMFVNEIVYDHPALVNSIVGKSIAGKTDIALSTSRYSNTSGTTVRRSPSSASKQLPGILSPAKEVDELFASSSSTPVMDRPRTLGRELERGIFPPNRDYELAAEMRYKKERLTMTLERASNLPPPASSKPLFSPPKQQGTVKKKPSRELVFPIPPVRTISSRKPAPPPISITIPAIFSPEIIQKLPTPDAPDTPEEIPSAKPAIPEKSEKRMTPGVSEHQAMSMQDEDATYETAQAWLDSVSPIEETTRSSYSDSLVEHLPSTAYMPESRISSMSSLNMSGFTASTILRRSLISLTTSPKIREEDEGEFTDIDIDSCSEMGEDDEGSDELTQSEADEMIMSGGEGYSSEGDSYEEDYFTDSDEGRGYRDDGVVISDVEDGTTYDKIALAERKLNAKLHAFTADSLPNAIPRHFQIGDRIPTFSESRRKYGNRRKPPPSPIGFLMRQRRESQQQIQARLMMLAGNQTLAPLEDLMNRLPAGSKRNTRVSYISDGRNSLLARLEMEMGQQESQWIGMQQDLKRGSMESSEDSPAQRVTRLSQNLAQRRSLLAKLNNGIDRRLNAQTTMTSRTTISPVPSPGASNMWQQKLAEAQMEYLAQAPSFSNKVGEMSLKPMSILASQHTPVSVISESEFDHSEVGSPLSIHGEAQRKSFYQNDNLNFVIEEDDTEEEIEDYEVEYEEEEEEEEEKYYGEEFIQPLQATVYCPSIRSASLRQESPAQGVYSTTEAFSPRTKPPVSLLWNLRIPQEAISRNSLLWNHRPSTPKSTFVFPPAIDLRPRQRISTAPLAKPTSHLWAKPRPTRSTSVNGLWHNPKEFRTKSIIISPSPTGRTRRSLKRVTFMEEVVIVEPTGIFGRLKKLWGTPKKTPQPTTDVPVPTVLKSSNARQSKVEGGSIGKVMDAIAIKYANKMLPPLPVQEPEAPEVPAKDPQTTVYNALWSKKEKMALALDNTKLWISTPAPKPEQAFTKDASEIRTKARAATPSVLESSNLWGMTKTTVSATLWKKTHPGYLWPQGPTVATPSGHLWPSASSLPVAEYGPVSRFTRAPSALALASLESTELWKAVVVNQEVEESTRLWSGTSTGGQGLCLLGSADIRTFDYLWPTATPLPTSYLIVDVQPIIRSRPTTTLEVLTSRKLWQSASTVTTSALWTAPVKKSALWPQGEVVKATTGTLWPSAASLKFEIQAGPRSYRAPSTLGLASLESTELWEAAVVEPEMESTGLWSGKSNLTHEEFYFEEPAEIRTFDYLWPTASPLPASHLVDVAPLRSRSSTAVLPTLKSCELWRPASAAASPKLWTAPSKRSALWPHGEVLRVALGTLWPSAALLSLEVEAIPHTHRAPSELTLTPLESTELWKATVIEYEEKSTGLWSSKSISSHDQELYFEEPTYTHTRDYLWPTAASLPVPHLAIDLSPLLRSRPPNTVLPTLTSHDLWQPTSTTPNLWTPPTKNSALWPQGEAPRTLGSLWPSAASLPSETQAVPRSYRVPLVITMTLESTELWKAVVKQEVEESTGLWSSESSSCDQEVCLEPVQDRRGDYLWPAAASLPVEYLVVDVLPFGRSRRSTTLTILESNELWQPASTATVPTLWTAPMKKNALWPQGEISRVSGSLWPSAATLSLRTEVRVHSYKTPRTLALGSLQSTDLWGTEIVTPTLWTAPTKKSPLWPQGEISTASGSLWPSAAALPLRPETRLHSSRAPKLALAPLHSTHLWGTAVIAPTLWTAPTKKNPLWPHGEISRASGSLWPSAATLPPTPEARLHTYRTLKLTLAPLHSTHLWGTAVIAPTLWTAPKNKSALWPQGEISRASRSLWPSATTLPPTPEARLHSSRAPTLALAPLQSTHLWGTAVTPALWTAQAKKSALWPQGKLVESIVGGMWPSAADLGGVIEVVVRVRSRCVAVAGVVSGALWVRCERGEVVGGGLWKGEERVDLRMDVESIEEEEEEEEVEQLINANLWTRPQNLPSTASSYLWPSARQLPAYPIPASNPRTHSRSAPLQPLKSTSLWPAKPTQATLWSRQTQQPGLWPSGTPAKTTLWPSAFPLPTLTLEPAPHRSQPLYAPTVLQSYLRSEPIKGLWSQVPTAVAAGLGRQDARNFRTETTARLWRAKPQVIKNGLWPEGEVDRIGLWPSASLLSVPMDRTVIRARYVPKGLTTLESRELWKTGSVPTLWTNTKSSRLWPCDKGKVVSSGLWCAPDNAVILRRSNLTLEITVGERVVRRRDVIGTIKTVSGALWSRAEESRLEIGSAVPGLWVRPSPGRGVAPRRKTVQPATLWASPLPEASRQRTSTLWDSTAALAQINARARDRCELWSRPISAHLSVASRSKRRTSNPLEPATGSLWAPARDEDPAVHSGLWDHVHSAPRGLAFVPPKCDKPLQHPVIPVSIPAALPIPSLRSNSVNKRASNITTFAPPLFLAPPPESPHAPARMWPASESFSRPRELWRPPISGTESAPWSSNTTLALNELAITETESKLWSKLHSGNLLFSDTTQSIRSVRNPGTSITASMEGPLWKSPDDVSNLWRKKEELSGLWTVNGVTASVTVPVATTHLWCENPNATAPIFADLSLESSRSRREFTSKTFSAPPDGLWKKVSEPVIEPNTGLWGTVETSASEEPLLLWQKDSTAAPMFADLPVESYRSKKDHSTVTLPVFSEGMWKKRVALPEKPQLWKPTSKSTYLWDSSSKTKTLAQMLLEKKAKEIKRPLWTKNQASRTTAKTPQRSPLVTVRISDDTTLPKVSGGLWKPKTAAKQLPQLWTPPKVVAKSPKPASTPLWAKEYASRRTEAVPERTKVAFIPSDAPLPVVSGTLWKPKSPEKKAGLWQRPIKTVATYRRTSVSVPLWAKETASRTTTARPERHTFVPKKKEASTTLSRVSGSLWQPKAAPPDKLWEAPTPAPKPRRGSLLWAKHAASQVTTPLRTSVPKHVIDPPLPVVSGTLWHQKPTSDAKTLWKLPVETTPPHTTSPLWSKEHASRTTTARPSRAPFVPKPPPKSHILPAATGDLWKPAPVPIPVALWTRKSSTTGVWDAEGRTPSLAEINRRLEARQNSLWQRRSVLTSKAASADPVITKPFAQKKKIDTSTTPALGNLWQPISPVIHSSVMWITRSPRSSSVDGEFVSPNLSRASTLSDMSEGEMSPSTMEDRFEPGIARVHSTKASISSSAGEMLWRPAREYRKKKELALWSGEGREERRSVLVSERPTRIPLPGDQERELPMFDASHSLWKPSVEETKTIWTNYETLCDSSCSETDFHDAESHDDDECSSHDAESDFHDAESQLSDDSHYEDFEHVSPQRQTFELDHSPASQSHVVVGQFRRDNYLPHSSQAEQVLPEGSPFASNIRIRSLRRKLRPTITHPEERRREATAAEESLRENLKGGDGDSGEMGPVAPGAGWLWSKGIV